MRSLSLLLALSALCAMPMSLANTSKNGELSESSKRKQSKVKKVDAALDKIRISTGGAGAAPSSGPNEAAVDKPFNDIDRLFVQKYGATALSHGQQIRPVIVVTGFTYHLFTEKGEVDKFDGPTHVSAQLRSIAHLGPCFFAIGTTHWNDLKDKSWKDALVELQTKLDLATKACDQVDWSNEAWPGGETKLKAFALEGLGKAKDFADKLIAKGDFERDDYSDFATAFTPYMVSMFYLDALSGTYNTLTKLNGWKKQLGEDAWSSMYLVVGGSPGRTTAGLTKETNPSVAVVSSLMDPERVSTNILIAPAALTTGDALDCLGTVLNAHDLAGLTFTTPETQKAGGFYSALRTFDVPLATKSIKDIVRDLRDGKAKDPVLGLGPTAPL